MKFLLTHCYKEDVLQSSPIIVNVTHIVAATPGDIASQTKLMIIGCDEALTIAFPFLELMERLNKEGY